MAIFETLAAKCAAGVALDLLVAIASIQSGLHPFAVRDGASLMRAGSPGEGIALAVGAADQGREVRIGLMGLSERQLRTAGLAITDGFDACASMTAAAQLFRKSRTVIGEDSEAADRSAMQTWWQADGRFPSFAALQAAVDRERTKSAVLAKTEIPGTSSKPAPPSATDELPWYKTAKSAAPEPDCWDIFARQRANLSQCKDAAGAPSNL
jgi:type IV secretion system protein VirB1